MVIWSDVLGGVQPWPHPLSCHRFLCPRQVSSEWGETGEAEQCCLHSTSVSSQLITPASSYQPSQHLCFRYELICQCWTESPDERPSFQDLSQAVNSFLEGIAGYLDFSAFSSEASQTGRYDHLEKRVLNGGYDHLESN